jgi:PilZ domain
MSELTDLTRALRPNSRECAMVNGTPGHVRDNRERRRAVRHLCGHRIMLQPICLRPVAALPAQVRDISVTGIGVTARSLVAPTTFVYVELQSMRDGKTRRLRARVVHATQLNRGMWLLGCALTDELDPKELEGLL